MARLNSQVSISACGPKSSADGSAGLVPASTAVGSLRVAAILAALFGLVLIWGVGFAGPSAIHNAAHDARHSIAFPCH